MEATLTNREPARKETGGTSSRRFRCVDVLLTIFIGLCGVVLAGELGWPIVLAWMNRPRAGVQVARRFETLESEEGPALVVDYLLYLPERYEQEGSRWPLVLFLHGAGGRGGDLKEVEQCEPPASISQGKAFPFVLVSPQCPSHGTWNPSVLLHLADHVVQSYCIDPERVYVTGYSMGGAGTWDLAVAAPERFAAIAPLAGGGDECQAERLMELPIWAFHGAVDQVVPLSRSRRMVDAVRAAGGDAKLTVYENEGHGIDQVTYARADFWDWLLAQRRAGRGSDAPHR